MTAADADIAATGTPHGAAPARGRLEGLNTGARITGDQAAAHSRFVRRMRIALPIVGVLLVAAFFMTSGGERPADVLLEEFADANINAEDLTIAKPQFSGIDSKGDPYDITAEAARRPPDGADEITLDKPRAVTSSEDARTVVSSNAGVFNTKTKVLDLTEGVTLEHRIGAADYVLTTPTARVSVDDKTVLSDKGVTAVGPDGAELAADAMRADDATGAVKFEGNVRMRIYPKARTGGEAATDKGETEQ